MDSLLSLLKTQVSALSPGLKCLHSEAIVCAESPNGLQGFCLSLEPVEVESEFWPCPVFMKTIYLNCRHLGLQSCSSPHWTQLRPLFFPSLGFEASFHLLSWFYGLPGFGMLRTRPLGPLGFATTSLELTSKHWVLL